MSTLAKAIALAAQAHVDQVDKAGQPYILHPLRMVMALAATTLPPEKQEAAQIVAVLHDVVEDTPYTLEDLRQAGFSEQIVTALDCVTRRADESYEEFIERLQDNELARLVKLADLEDNMDFKRIAEIGERDLERMKRYHNAWHKLTEYCAER